tara:strand:- start:211 stop:450 length:240 start_codon:yes stop_codon:yes gene_type:complete
MKRGRPKGYSPYVNIPYEELADFVGRKSPVKVCRAWLEELIKQTNMGEQNPYVVQNTPHEKIKAEQPKIEYELTTFDED